MLSKTRKTINRRKVTEVGRLHKHLGSTQHVEVSSALAFNYKLNKHVQTLQHPTSYDTKGNNLLDVCLQLYSLMYKHYCSCRSDCHMCLCQITQYFRAAKTYSALSKSSVVS